MAPAGPEGVDAAACGCFLSGPLIPIRKALGATVPAERSLLGTLTEQQSWRTNKQHEPRNAESGGAAGGFCHCWQTQCGELSSREAGDAARAKSLWAGHVIKVHIG